MAPSEAQRALAALAVRQLLERYFSCIDRRDWTGLADCFAEDAHAVYNSGQAQTLAGRAAIVERLRVVERFAATNHILSNAHVTIGNHDARSITHAVAHLLPAEGSLQRILVRGLRYEDDLALDAGTWRISRRVHQPLWQYEADAIPPGY